MTINNKFIYLVMYDIPIETKKQARAYRKFRKRLVELGAYQLQESVYLIQVSNKKQKERIKKELDLAAPECSHIRSLLITQQVFERMETISGEKTLSEKLLSNQTRIIEL